MRVLLLAAFALRFAAADSFSLSATTFTSLSFPGTQVNSQSGVNPVMSSSAITFNSALPCIPFPGNNAPCYADASVSATASATYGQISLSANDFMYAGGGGLGRLTAV
jgi:hypothetical protein